MYSPIHSEKVSDCTSSSRRRSYPISTAIRNFLQVCKPRAICSSCRNLIDIAQYRPFALLLAACVTVLVFFQTFHVQHHGLVRTTYNPFSSTNEYERASSTRPQRRVKKVSALFGAENELYEAALQTHEEHNAIHGYEFNVLRQRILNNFWSKPAYLLSQIIEELAKPEDQRVEWLMWVAADIMILNPQIPLELFLPPDEFEKVHFIGTHDDNGFSGSSFLLRVSEWSVQMLIEVLALPKVDPSFDLGLEKDQGAFDNVIRSERFRDGVVYQPRLWFNAYQTSADLFEGKRGSLLVHFLDLGGDKWVAMSNALALLQHDPTRGNIRIEETPYVTEVQDYWSRLRQAANLLGQVEENDDNMRAAADRLRWMRHYESDRVAAVEDALHELRSMLDAPREEVQ